MYKYCTIPSQLLCGAYYHRRNALLAFWLIVLVLRYDINVEIIVEHKYHLLALGLVMSLVLSACATEQEGPMIEEDSSVAGAISRKIVNLDQNWTTDTQQAFYFTTQGSRILPYSWYIALEQAGNQILFRDNAHMQALRYLPDKKSHWNPDGLAVGFVKDTDKETKKEWMGFTCAACHTAQIDYRSVGIRIEGGPTMGDFERFNVALVDALNATYKSNGKFSRFSDAVLGKNHSADEEVILRNELKQQTLILAERNNINHSGKNQPDYGYGRLDAIGAIFNQILSHFNDMPNNGLIADAPASYPFLWGTHQSDVVQWTGFAPNGPASLGALIRNGGEVLGVYGQLDIPDKKSIKHYKSSISIINLGKLESWVAKLRSPIWPAEYFPPINLQLAAKGKLHYDRYCISCHQVMTREQQGDSYKAILTPLSEVGTDPQEIKNMLKQRLSGNFKGRKEGVVVGDVIGEKTTGLSPLVNSVVGSLLEHPMESIEAAIIEYEGGLVEKSEKDKIISGIGDSSSKALEAKVSKYIELYHKQPEETKGAAINNKMNAGEIENGEVYKARPLAGIWSTGPYLHNGSVLSIAELLQPVNKRRKKFYLGTREFDPVNIGYVSKKTIADATAFEFDTGLVGNSNSGHEYGTVHLSDSDKKELLEYIKTL